MKIDIASMTYEELTAFVIDRGLPKYRAEQIFRNIAKAKPIGQMTDLSKELREELAESCSDTTLKLIQTLKSSDGTEKYLFELEDGNVIESVLMKYNHGNSVCISSQVGCAMGCKFCASSLMGKNRNLTAGEMLMQVAAVNSIAGISNIVIMGIGEPFDNYDNFISFLKNVNDSRGLNIGQRHISVSTCGIVDKIIEFAKLGMGVTLSVSLHAPDNETRNQLMPINKAYPVETLIDACRFFIEKTGRRISFEYTLVKGINDSEIHAKKLADLLRGLICHINLIPVNHVEERGLYAPGEKTIHMFQTKLENSGYTVTVRRTLGSDINASCGQLRYKYISNYD